VRRPSAWELVVCFGWSVSELEGCCSSVLLEAVAEARRQFGNPE
jgi:hypothetical protein